MAIRFRSRNGSGACHAGGGTSSDPLESRDASKNAGAFPVHGEGAGAAGDDTPVALQNIRIPDGVPAEGPYKILVIGSTAEIREETVRILLAQGGPGWEPDATGEDGPSMRKRVSLEAWDLVLLRLDAGPLDFRDLFRSLRAAQHWPPPPVVAVMHPDPSLQGELKALGAVQTLITPLTEEVLVRALSHALSQDLSSRAGQDSDRNADSWWEDEKDNKKNTKNDNGEENEAGDS